MIERATTRIFVQKDDQLLNTASWSYKNEGIITGILGILNFQGLNFLGVITQHYKCGHLNKAAVNKVTAVKFLPFKVSI